MFDLLDLLLSCYFWDCCFQLIYKIFNLSNLMVITATCMMHIEVPSEDA